MGLCRTGCQGAAGIRLQKTNASGMTGSIGFDCPLYFYKMLCTRREGFTPEGIRFVNAQRERLCQRILNATLYDLRQSDIWDEEDPCWGVFSPDMCHYRARTQKFLAQRFPDEIL